MAGSDAPFEAFSADGHEVSWTTIEGDHAESMTLRWENEAWTATGQIRRLGLAVGQSAEIDVISVDVDNLGAIATPTRYERTGERTWRATSLPSGAGPAYDLGERGPGVGGRGRFTP